MIGRTSPSRNLRRRAAVRACAPPPSPAGGDGGYRRDQGLQSVAVMGVDRVWPCVDPPSSPAPMQHPRPCMTGRACPRRRGLADAARRRRSRCGSAARGPGRTVLRCSAHGPGRASMRRRSGARSDPLCVERVVRVGPPRQHADEPRPDGYARVGRGRQTAMSPRYRACWAERRPRRDPPNQGRSGLSPAVAVVLDDLWGGGA